MKDRFFKVTHCDRCHQNLANGRTLSMYNEDVLCLSCKDKESQRDDYNQAVKADQDEIKKGNYNFKGIGLK